MKFSLQKSKYILEDTVWYTLCRTVIFHAEDFSFFSFNGSIAIINIFAKIISVFRLEKLTVKKK